MPEYLALNPNAVVPTMIHNGRVLIESSIIIVYTDEAFDGPSLRPDTAIGRAQVAAWLKRADDAYLPALGAVTYGLFRRKQILLKSAEELAAYYMDIPDPKRRAQRKSIVENGIAAPNVVQAFPTLDGMLADMEEAFAGNGHLVDGGYALADAALTPFVWRLDELAMDWMWARKPNLAG